MTIERVLIINTDPVRPTYHAIRDVLKIDRREWLTGCGEVFDFDKMHSAHLRRDHANEFARPCQKCYPNSITMVMDETTSPSCKGWNFHVFPIGSDKCSVCGWRRR